MFNRKDIFVARRLIVYAMVTAFVTAGLASVLAPEKVEPFYDALAVGKLPLVMGTDGRAQQLQTGDWLRSPGGLTLNGTSPSSGELEATTVSASGVVAGLEFRGAVVTTSAVSTREEDYAGCASAFTCLVNADDTNSGLGGITGGAAGREMTIINVGTQTLDLFHDWAGSTAANRFYFPWPSESWGLNPKCSATFRYNGTTSRWDMTAWGCDSWAHIASVYNEVSTGGLFHHLGSTIEGGASYPTLSADQDDWAFPTGVSHVGIFPDGTNVTITGMGPAPSSDGYTLTIYNISGTYKLTLTDDDPASSAGLRFSFPRDQDIVLEVGDSVKLRYSTGQTAWILADGGSSTPTYTTVTATGTGVFGGLGVGDTSPDWLVDISGDASRVVIDHPTSASYATFDFARAGARRFGMGLEANSDNWQMYRATGAAGAESETQVVSVANSTGAITITPSVDITGALNGYTQIMQSADQDVTNAGVTDSNTFLISTTAGKSYLIQGLLSIGGNNTTGDGLFDWAVAAGTADCSGTAQHLNASDAATNTAIIATAAADTSDVPVGTRADASIGIATTFYLACKVSNTTTLKLRFGNNAASSGRTTRMKAGSRILYRQLD